MIEEMQITFSKSEVNLNKLLDISKKEFLEICNDKFYKENKIAISILDIDIIFVEKVTLVTIKAYKIKKRI